MGRMPLFVLFSVLFLVYGSHASYFLQDDIVYLIGASQGLKSFFLLPANEHLNYIFRLLVSVEWQFFGLNYTGYLFISILIHLVNVLLLGRIVNKITKSSLYGNVASILFLVNTNWTETVFWFSGQSFTLSVAFVLVGYFYLIERSNQSYKRSRLILESVLFTLPGLTSGVGIWMPISTLLVYGFKSKKATRVGLSSFISISILVTGYIFFVEGNVFTYYLREFSLRNVSLIIIFPFLAFFNATVGRLFIPWDSLEVLRIAPVAGLICYLYLKRKQLSLLFRSKVFLFPLISLIVYYSFVTLGRVIYGIGASRAERYTYIGLLLLIILMAQVLKQLKFSRRFVLMISTFLAVIQISGLYSRSIEYKVRPALTKQMFISLINADREKCYTDQVLPPYIDRYTNLRFSVLNSLLDEKLEFDTREDCQSIDIDRP